MKTPALLRLGFILALLTAPLALSISAPVPKPIVLKGLDPVLLVSGTEKPGAPEFFSEFGKFRYVFANAANKQRFDASPAAYAVQLDGGCAMSPEMPGDPAQFAVYEGRIFLAGSDMCLTAAKASPKEYLKARAREQKKKVAILLFPGVQIIDYTGPFEVFGQAGFQVYTVAESTAPLKTNMGMTVTPDYAFAEAPQPDVLVLPGGNVPGKAEKTHPAIRWILAANEKTTHTLSVCNGAFWLANAGLLDGLEATTFYGLLGELKESFPKVRVVSDKRFCDNGHIITTAGLSSGIDGALHTVERFFGLGTARAVALNMEYQWQPDSTYARGAFADRFLREGGKFKTAFPENVQKKLLDRRGDRDQWDETWQLDSARLKANALFEFVSNAAPKTWVKADAPANDGGAWQFQDEAGSSWRLTAGIAAVAETKDRYVFTVAIRRAGAEKATAQK